MWRDSFPDSGLKPNKWWVLEKLENAISIINYQNQWSCHRFDYHFHDINNNHQTDSLRHWFSHHTYLPTAQRRLDNECVFGRVGWGWGTGVTRWTELTKHGAKKVKDLGFSDHAKFCMWTFTFFKWDIICVMVFRIKISEKLDSPAEQDHFMLYVFYKSMSLF